MLAQKGLIDKIAYSLRFNTFAYQKDYQLKYQI